MSTDYRKEKIRITILDSKEEKEHFHQDVELLHVLEGSLSVSIGSNRSVMMPGDVLLINSEKEHYLRGTDDILYMKLSIEYSMVSDILNRYDIIFWCDSSKSADASYDELRQMLRRLLGHYLSTQSGVQNFSHIAMCYQIIDYLCSHFLVRAAAQQTEEEKYQARIEMINNYIRTNYDKAISLKDLSEKLYLSNGYLSRFFKKNYHMSFMEHLTKVRLYHAVDAILYSDMPITRIALDTGFASVAIFNRAFKEEYGETPSAVRKRVGKEKKNLDEEKIVVTERLEKYLWHESEEGSASEGTGKTVYQIEVQELAPMKNGWNRIINIGSGKDLLRSELREHLSILKESMGFVYARFWNLFSEDMLINVNGTDTGYNFSRIDSILDFLTGSGWIPFIELAPKPLRIQKNQLQSVVYEEEQQVLSLDLWKELIHAFIRHLIVRYEDISEWKFELWMDDRYLIDSAHIEDYIKRFIITFDEIKKLSPKTAVGGCGIHTYTQAADDKSFYIRQFFRKCYMENSSRMHPDFISGYCYSYDSILTEGGFVSKRNSDMTFMSRAIGHLKQDMMDSGLKETDIYITEWNLTVSDRNYINDSCFKGAYIIRNFIDSYGTADAFGYFSGSDRTAEHYDTNAPLFGGNGLVTRDGVLKPAAYAYQFINRLYHYYVGRGEYYFLTADGHGNFAMICHNCKELNYNYYYEEEDHVEKAHMAKYFDDHDVLTLSFQLCGLEDDEYHIKKYRVNKNNGSVLDLWKETNFETDLSRNDIHYLRRVCEPKLLIQTAASKDRMLSFDLSLLANEIMLVRILKRI